ncbi:MAG: hypothetical protein J2P33_09705 [Actinobacteria bacterium]|nr:hypothetical protein [Actinomycetota bacterium]
MKGSGRIAAQFVHHNAQPLVPVGYVVPSPVMARLIPAVLEVLAPG